MFNTVNVPNARGAGETPGGASAGFTLMEILVAVMLFAMLLGTVTALYAATFRRSTDKIKQSIMHGFAAIAASNLETDVAQATYILSPATGGSSNAMLIGFINVADEGGGQVYPLPGKTWEKFEYLVCGSQLYYWRWDLTADSASLNSVKTCSSPNPKILITDPIQLLPGDAGYVFSRPATDQISLSLDLRLPRSGANDQIDVPFNREINAEEAAQSL